MAEHTPPPVPEGHTIRRAASRHRFVVVDQAAVRDKRLSLRARGLLVYLLSMPDDWRIRSRQIAGEVREGREAVRTAMRELYEAGYMVTERTRRHGRFVAETVVYETPQPVTARSQPATRTEAQETGVGFPGPGFLGLLSTTQNERPSRTNPPVAPPNGNGHPTDAAILTIRGGWMKEETEVAETLREVARALPARERRPLAASLASPAHLSNGAAVELHRRLRRLLASPTWDPERIAEEVASTPLDSATPGRLLSSRLANLPGA